MRLKGKIPRQWVRYCNRVGALLAPLLLGGLAYLIVLPIQTALQDRSAQIEEKRAQYLRYKSFIQRAGRIQPEALVQFLSKHRAHVFLASGPSIASSKLQSSLKLIASAKSIQITSLRTLPSTRKVDDRSIGVRVNMRGNLGQLQQIIHAIENAKPFMFVDAMALSARRSARAVGEQQTVLDAQLDVRGQYEIEQKAKGS